MQQEHLTEGQSAAYHSHTVEAHTVVFDKCRPKTFLRVIFRERIGYANGCN